MHALIDNLAGNHAEMTAIRRDIHAHPELGFEEHRTSDLVAEKLTDWGIEVTRGIGQTGLVGTLRVGNDPRSVGLRADMDALPIVEANTFEHCSRHPGVMHACGHDGHTAMLLGAARYLAETRNFEGCVHFIFQPAEEGIGGARAMVNDGLFEKFPCDSIFGMHNRPGMDIGNFAIRPGAMMAGGALFDITVTGVGAHGARPESGVDPVVVAAQIVTAGQTIVARNISPRDTAVLSFTQIHGGAAYNVIPQSARIMGTARAFSMAVMGMIEDNMRRMAESIAAGFGATAELDFRLEFMPTVNNATETLFAIECARDLVGGDNVNEEIPLVMASEDFSYMLNERPGAYIFVGNGAGEGGCEVHNPGYDFNDQALPFGAAYFVNVVEKKLARR